MSGRNLSDILENCTLEEPSSWSVIREDVETYKGLTKWAINTSKIRQLHNIGDVCNSEHFHIGGKRYCQNLKIMFYPSGRDRKSEDFVSIYIHFYNTPDKGTAIKGRITFINENGKSLLSKSFSQKGDSIPEIGFECFVEKKRLDRYFSGDKLIILCNIKITNRLSDCKAENRSFSVTPCDEGASDYTSVLLENQSLVDVKLVIGQEEFWAHKAILASRIPLLRIRFKGAPLEQNSFELNDIESNVFKEILRYVYTGEIPLLNFKLASKLYFASHNYLIPELSEISSSYLGANLSEKNVYVTQALAHRFQDVNLKRACIDFTKSCDSQLLANESLMVDY